MWLWLKLNPAAPFKGQLGIVTYSLKDISVVYFDQLLGAVGTQKLVKNPFFWPFLNFLLILDVFADF